MFTASVSSFVEELRCCGPTASQSSASPTEGVVQKVAEEAAEVAPPKRIVVGQKYEIMLDRTSGEELGLDVREGPPLLVTTIREGLVSEWNHRHPETPVLTGDYIVRANGKSEQICAECMRFQVLRLELIRPVLREFEDAQRRTAHSLLTPPEDASAAYHASLEDQAAVQAMLPAVSAPLPFPPEESCANDGGAMVLQRLWNLRCVADGASKERIPEASPQSSWRRQKATLEGLRSGEGSDCRIIAEETRQWHRLEESLMSSHFKLLKGSFLVECSDTGRCIQHFQDLPADAFWDPHQAALLTEEENQRKFRASLQGVEELPGFLHAVSYHWLSKEHPDPDGFHLRLITHVVKLAMQAREAHGLRPDIGIFWDVACLSQESLKDMGSADAQQCHATKLRSSAVLYTTRSCCVWFQPMMPAGSREDSTGGSVGESSRAPWTFEESGWCYFELSATNLGRLGACPLDISGAQCAPQKCSMSGVQQAGAAVATNWSQLVAQCQKPWCPPLSPENFAAELEHRIFGDSSHAALVNALYREAFDLTIGSKDCVDFSFLSWGPLEMMDLAKTLPHLNCMEMVLDGNPISDRGAVALASALTTMVWLRKIRVAFSSIGETGACSIASAFSVDHHCEALDLSFNPIGDPGTEALASGLAWLPLRDLRLQGCGIGDRGAGAMAALVAQAPAIKLLVMSQNNLSSAARDRLEAVWASSSSMAEAGALRAGRRLLL